MLDTGTFLSAMLLLVCALATLAAWWQIRIATSTRRANKFLFKTAIVAFVLYLIYHIVFLALPEVR